ncbi:MAG: hypothetical protein AB3N64_09815 [Puniceicoccaceae bacterium]
MKNHILLTSAMTLMTGSLAFSAIQLYQNNNFDYFPVSPDSPNYVEGVDVPHEMGAEGSDWIAGTNSFTQFNQWKGFRGNIEGNFNGPLAPVYDLTDRVAPEGNGFVYNRWDDEKEYRLDNFLFQEFWIGDEGGATPNSLFVEGDEVVFSGYASYDLIAANPSDIGIEAYIKVMGYNSIGWDNQNREWTRILDLREDATYGRGENELAYFEVRTVLPDSENWGGELPDAALQRIQIGLGITTRYDSTAKAMDDATIYFEDLDAVIINRSLGGWEEHPVFSWTYRYSAQWVWNYTIGFAELSSFPWVYSPKHGWWYMSGDDISGDNYIYFASTDKWAWITESYGGFFYYLNCEADCWSDFH